MWYTFVMEEKFIFEIIDYLEKNIWILEKKKTKSNMFWTKSDEKCLKKYENLLKIVYQILGKSLEE